MSELDYLKQVPISIDVVPGGTAGFFSSVFNLMNAILGSGIVGLPYALLNLGYLGFFIALVLVAGLAMFAIDLLLKICDLEKTTSYEVIAERAFGKIGKMYASIAILVHTMIAMCSFMFIVRYEAPAFLQGLFGLGTDCESANEQVWFTNTTLLVILVIWGIVAPLAMARQIDFLGFTSGIAMACMCLFTLIIMIYKYILTCPIKDDKRAQGFIDNFKSFETQANSTDAVCKIENVFSEHAIHFHQTVVLNNTQVCEPVAFTWNVDSVYAIPTMLFAFQCHASCLPVYTELKTANRKSMMKVASTAIFAVWLIYSLVSFFSYFTFYNVTMEEVLMMYSSLDASEPLVLIARACCLICVIFSAPLLHYPCRKAQTILIWGEDALEKNFSWTRHVALAVINLIIVTLIVLFFPSINILFGYGGAVTANSLVLILPSLFYWKLVVKKRNEESHLSWICPLFSGAGVLMMAVSVYLLATKEDGGH